MHRYVRHCTVAIAAAAVAAPLSAQQGTAPPAITTPVEDARFEPADPARPNGSQLAVLRGDPATGPSDMLFLQKRGETPLHSHGADYHLSLVSGMMRHWNKGEDPAEAKLLGPGSYWFQPGDLAHVDVCLTEQCVMFIHWGGKRTTRLED